jgi:long-chain acyl-CoA synthetase
MDQVSRKNIGEDSTKKLSMLLRIPVVNSIIKKTTTEIRVARGKIYIISGAANSSQFSGWFETIGITVLEGYGMSEDTIISHFNIATDNRVGTVGKAVAGVSVKISPEGEICIKISA